MSPDVKWASDDPKRVPVPYNVADKETRQGLRGEILRVEQNVPIFGDPRITPIFHGAGPYILEPDKKDGKPNPQGRAFLKWLDEHPDRNFGLLLNYHPDNPISAAGKAKFLKYRDRFVGSIAGESLGYFYVKPDVMKAATASAKNRRDLAEAITTTSLASECRQVQDRLRARIGRTPIAEVIPCQSIGMPAFAPLCYSWGAAHGRLRVVGDHERHSLAADGVPARRCPAERRHDRHVSLVQLRRRQHDLQRAIELHQAAEHPRQLLQRLFRRGHDLVQVRRLAPVHGRLGDVLPRAGLRRVLDAGRHDGRGPAPGATLAQGQDRRSLSEVSAAHPDRGVPFTPVAFLVDYAHGWDPAPFSPHSFDDYAKRPELTRYGDHEQMLQEYFWTAYHPIGIKAEAPTTGTSEVNVPGMFGDIFDVIYAYPDVKKWTTIDTYPVVIAAGDIALTAAEGKRLAKYVEDGGTLLVADSHLTGPGADASDLPKAGAIAEADSYTWKGVESKSQRFRYRPLEGGTPLGHDRRKVLLLRIRPRQGPADRAEHPPRSRHRQDSSSSCCPPAGTSDKRANADRSSRRRRVDAQSHCDRLDRDALQPSRPEQATTRHHADGLSPESIRDDSNQKAGEIGQRLACAGGHAER